VYELGAQAEKVGKVNNFRLIFGNDDNLMIFIYDESIEPLLLISAPPYCRNSKSMPFPR